MLTLNYATLAAWIAAFVLTVVLARFLTPQRWWRNANARAAANAGQRHAAQVVGRADAERGD